MNLRNLCVGLLLASCMLLAGCKHRKCCCAPCCSPCCNSCCYSPVSVGVPQ